MTAGTVHTALSTLDQLAPIELAELTESAELQTRTPRSGTPVGGLYTGGTVSGTQVGTA